jgi:hypothetical protein
MAAPQPTPRDNPPAQLPDYEAVAAQALALSVADKIRLIQRLASQLERDIQERQPVRESGLYGALADLGPGPSAEDIDEVRREIWGSYVGERPR